MLFDIVDSEIFIRGSSLATEDRSLTFHCNLWLMPLGIVLIEGNVGVISPEKGSDVSMPG